MRGVLRDAASRLQAAGSPSARLDAELLLCEVLGTDRSGLVLAPERELAADEAAAFEGLVARREQREPVAYLLGRRGFRGIELRCDARALVPRPETELLVEAGLGLARGARVVDVGTGTGAVALALKHERPDLQVVATDIDAGALALAAENAAALGLEIELHRADLLAGVAGTFDAVLSNPPYVGAADDRIDPELAFEPDTALFSGGDGLDLVRRLVPEAFALASFVALEIGEGQAPAVAELMLAAGAARTESRADLAGIERVVAGWR